MSLYVHRGEGWGKFEYVGRGVVWSRVYAVIDRERERKKEEGGWGGREGT